MKLHQVKDANNNIIGETTNVSELNSFLAAHPGYRSQELRDVDGPSSTLPKLQEEPSKPAGDFLRQ